MKAQITEPAIIFRISRLYRPSMSQAELYEATRRSWKLNKTRALKAQLALAAEGGTIRAVYKPLRWVPTPDPKYPGRWAFEGEVADEAQKLVGKSVAHLFKRGDRSPFKYLNM